MASAAAAIDQAANPKSVDESLWWDSFAVLLNDFENAPLSTAIPHSLVKSLRPSCFYFFILGSRRSVTPSLLAQVKKLKNNHARFLETVYFFKPPNQTSRAALDSPQISVGLHRLIVQPELKDIALHVSNCLVSLSILWLGQNW